MNPVPRAAVIFLLAGATLAGCAAPSSGPSASAAQIAACRQRADQVYDRQNRADVYRADTYAGGTRDAMFSGTGSPGASALGLSARFARERMVDDCLRGAAGPASGGPASVAPGRAAP